MSADPFDTARTNFVGLGDLAGRAVLVYGTELQKDIPSQRPGAAGKTYDRVVADVVVLDGEPDDELGIDSLPYTIEGMFISGSVVVPQLRGKVGKRPVLGVVTKQKSTVKGNNDAVALNGEDVTPAQRKLALSAHEAYQAAQADPFA